MNIDIGIEVNKRQEIAAGLSRVLADSYTLYLKTHNFHWNVTGPPSPAEKGRSQVAGVLQRAVRTDSSPARTQTGLHRGSVHRSPRHCSTPG